jgi:hypothetical protein
MGLLHRSCWLHICYYLGLLFWIVDRLNLSHEISEEGVHPLHFR